MSALEDALAALMGGLEGGLEGVQFLRKTKREAAEREKAEERQRLEDEYRNEQRELLREDRARQARERERTEVGDLLAEMGRGSRVDDAVAARARGAGLGHRLDPEQTLTSSFFTGYSGTAGDDLASGDVRRSPSPGRPTGSFRVAPTPAERRADLTAEAKQREAAAATAAIEDAIGKLPPHLQGPARFGSSTGKMPTLGAAEFVTPEQRTAQEIAAAVEKEKALLPIKLRAREGEKAIDQKYAQLPVSTRDDPTLPRGVRQYLGDLVSKYQNDPAGARTELQQATPSLLQAHPSLDLVKVSAQMNALLPLPKEKDESILGDAPAAPPPRPAALPPPAKAASATPAAAVSAPPAADARAARARVLMQQIQQGRAKGQDTTALEQQLLALKRGTGAAVVH